MSRDLKKEWHDPHGIQDVAVAVDYISELESQAAADVQSLLDKDEQISRFKTRAKNCEHNFDQLHDEYQQLRSALNYLEGLYPLDVEIALNLPEPPND